MSNGNTTHFNLNINIWNSYIWTADKDRIIYRSSQWRCFNLSGWKEETWKIQAWTGIEPMTSAIPVQALLPTELSSQLGAGQLRVSTFQIRLKHLHCDETPSLRWSIYNSIFIRSSNIWISYINVHLFSIYGINTNSQLTSSQLAW